MKIFLLLLLASFAQACKEVSTGCEEQLAFETKHTIDQVIADINENLKDSSDFFVKFETDLHTFAVEMQSKLRADKMLLEVRLKSEIPCKHRPANLQRILKLQEVHGSNFTKSSGFDNLCTTHIKPQTKSERCKALAKNVTPCENCTMPHYDKKNMIYTCTKGYAFDVTKKSRQVRCEFVDSEIELVYEGNGKSVKYNGELNCQKLNAPIECPYTCSETAVCGNGVENKLVCACLKGYIDVSSQQKKPAGSICTKCNNSDPLGTDFVMLYDLSNSTIDGCKGCREKMINFLSDFLTFALVEFGSDARLRFPISSKINSSDIIEGMRADINVAGGVTNTPLAMKIANEQVYAELNSTRPRVTILFTDGQPMGFYTPFVNKTSRDDIFNNTARYEQINQYISDEANVLKKQGTNEELKAICHDFTLEDLKREVRVMKEDHKAQIITIYVGKNMEDEKSIQLMRAITAEDEELSVENFEASSLH